MNCSQEKVLIVQYAGDYRNAVNRFENGGEETYYAQKYSVDAVAKLKAEIEGIDEVATLCCLTQDSYNEVLSNGVRAIGTGFAPKIQPRKLLNLVADYNPTVLILRTPNQQILKWAIRNKKQTLVILADSFETKGLRRKIYNYQLARLLNHPQISWVGNHGVNAARSLMGIGVNPDKIIPWDWPHQVTPHTLASKSLDLDPEIWHILYVGAVKDAKGIGDAIEALAYLRNKGLSVQLKVAVKGDLDRFSRQAKGLGIEQYVEFLGLVPNKTIIPRMREADLVIVPSRHEYPEGFPMTIYETLCSRTPMVASDHPMFLDKLKNRMNALVFPASNPLALAQCIEELLSNPTLYQTLSAASCKTWDSLQIPVRWGDFVQSWLADSSEHKEWLFQNRFSSSQYANPPELKSIGYSLQEA
ncbi:MAG: glycosyltransferase [Oscillatoriales cyanobacterium RM2_1_1]|nr:glycosyltransferase [Oscillatoriales cyanobacterium SM2_3_0]NJO46917.1 glycosyltransferase [Oscillatoriales cyanobacterium RM2_1_1]